MRKGRVLSSQSQTRKTSRKKLTSLRFVGLALGGGKSDRTALAVLEYFPSQNKIFFSQLYTRLKTRDSLSADQQLVSILTKEEKKSTLIAVNAPLSFPKCLKCTLKCPGYERCQVNEIKWMRKIFQERAKKKKPNKLFTPYTERCIEIYLSDQLEEPFQISHAMGANAAPLLARLHFLKRRLPKAKWIEAFPPLSISRIGKTLNIPKRFIQDYRHSVLGQEARSYILKHLMHEDLIFVYDQDQAQVIYDIKLFEAFTLALTALLHWKGLCEPRPKDFPRSAGWMAFPETLTRGRLTKG